MLSSGVRRWVLGAEVLLLCSLMMVAQSQTLIPISERSQQWCQMTLKHSNEETINRQWILQQIKKEQNLRISVDGYKRLVRNLGIKQMVNQTWTRYCEESYAVGEKLEKKVIRKPRSGGQEEGSSEAGAKKEDNRKKVWIASVVALLIISAVGLLGVAVVPLVQKVFFNHVIQYLVAVAVGTLTGDAFMHLLPHSMGAHEHEEHDEEPLGEGEVVDEVEGWLNSERQLVLLGLLALGGVYFFFMAEKLVSLVSEHRAEKKAEEEERQRAIANPKRSMDARRMSSARGSMNLQVPVGPLRRGSRQIVPLDPNMRRNTRALSIADDNIITTGLSSRAMKNIDNLIRYAEESENEMSDEEQHQSKNKLGVDEIQIAVPSTAVITPDSQKNAAESGEKKGHGHGHSHEIPASMAAVAWMVILGDGLHNFTDGMAIGAAFAKDITGGISTTVAVFCHELPHELGDFAVLLKTGMGIKKAMFFNIVSSVLAFLGMLVGIALGNIEGVNKYIFVFTAGTFIYIALVDMLPELTGAEVKLDESRLVQFIIQNAGLFTGVGIMFLIAIFEDKFREMLD